MSKKIFLISLGCPKNLVDSEAILGQSDFEIVHESKKADIVLVNTCAFIDDATEESVDMILNLTEQKKWHKYIFVTAGCLVNRFGESKLKELLPEVDIFIRTDEIEQLKEKLADFFPQSDECCHLVPKVLTPKYLKYIKISEGCDNFCSYCTIPYIRGKLISRDRQDILDEIKYYARQKNIKELILIGQDITKYGYDLGKTDGLLRLLEEIETMKGYSGWVRLMYCNPGYFSKDLIDFISESQKVIKYIDFPIQHCNNDILKQMNRKYNKETIIQLYQELREKIPDLVLRTTLITGFPGETEKRFEELLEFIQEYPFEKLGGFVFQKQEGTAAAALKSTAVPNQLKEERLAILMGTQQEISKKQLIRFHGLETRMIVEKVLQQDDFQYSGRTYMDAPDIDGVTYYQSNRKLNIGDAIPVKITGHDEYDTFASVLYE